MQKIPLASLPNQSFSILLDNNQWRFTIKSTPEVTAISIILNNVTILDGMRIVPNQKIIPYRYLEAGNFLLSTLNQELPDYTEFGVSQFLIYASAAELAAIRTPSPLTATNFSPIAALPLRFKPQGY